MIFLIVYKIPQHQYFLFLFIILLLLTFFAHVLYHTRNIGYAIYGLSIEINSVFLHARRLLRWYSPKSLSIYDKNRLKIAIDAGNYITFIVFRFGIVFVGLRALHIQGRRLDLVIHIYTVLVTSVMGALNIVLFYRLIKNQFTRKSKRKQEKQLENKILMTNNHILLHS